MCVRTCMCMCVHVSVHVCMYVHSVCVHAYVYCMNMCVHVFVHVCACGMCMWCVHVCVYVGACVCMHMYVHMCVFVCLCMCVWYMGLYMCTSASVCSHECLCVWRPEADVGVSPRSFFTLIFWTGVLTGYFTHSNYVS